MKHYQGTLYRSRWDASTWGLITLTATFCLLPLVLDDDGWLPLAVCGAVLAFVFTVMLSVYYRIDGDNLIVYQMFIPTAYPIGKISDIAPTKSWLSAPATSLTHRIAIRFTDRSILKSTMPLVISPARQSDFIAHLRTINPAISVTEQ